jgi:hypothetical protein
VDHYDPLEPHTPAFFDTRNWRPSCATHNSAKRDTPGDEFVARLLAAAGRSGRPGAGGP